jgi:hypothetical protein
VGSYSKQRFFPAPSKLTSSKKGRSRPSRHTQLRAQNNQADLQRYARANVTNSLIAEAVREELQKLQITLTGQDPSDVTHPALPGIVVKIDESLFIGRQRLPLIATLLG